MKKWFLILGVVFTLVMLTPQSSKAGFFIGFPIPIPVFYGPHYYVGPGYYPPGYYWGPGGYAYYPHPYWRHRYWRLPPLCYFLVSGFPGGILTTSGSNLRPPPRGVRK